MHNDGIRVEINLRNFPKCVISSSNVASIQRFSFHIFFLRLECRKREKMTRETAKKSREFGGWGDFFFAALRGARMKTKWAPIFVSPQKKTGKVEERNTDFPCSKLDERPLILLESKSTRGQSK